jgi:hypothetical protein
MSSGEGASAPATTATHECAPSRMSFTASADRRLVARAMMGSVGRALWIAPTQGHSTTRRLAAGGRMAPATLEGLRAASRARSSSTSTISRRRSAAAAA